MENLAAYAHLLNRIDKAIVLDIGARYTKCGLACKSSPRYIITTRFITSNGKKLSLREPSYGTENDWKEGLEIFLRELFIKRMGLSKGYKIIILDSLLYSLSFRNALLYILLKRFKFSSVKFFIAESMSLYSILPKSLKNINLYVNGLIVDVGYRDTRVLPIYQSIAMIGKLQHGGVSSFDCIQRLRSLLLEYGIYKKDKIKPINECLLLNDDSVIEDIFVRVCFSCLSTYKEKYPPKLKYPSELKSCLIENNIEETINENNHNNSNNNFVKDENERVPSIIISLPDNSTLEINGYIRAHTADILFENTDYYPSIAAKILDCLLKCEIDIRSELAYSIILSGGIFKLPGLITRLLEECKLLLKTSKYESIKCLENQINFYSNDFNPITLQWVGASLLGTLQETGFTIALEDYESEQIKTNLPNYTKNIIQ